MKKDNTLEISFREGVEDWLNFKKPQIKEATYLNYKYKINSKFISEFGDKKIQNLLKYDFNHFVSKMMENMSEKTVKDLIVLLKQILSYFEKRYDVSFKIDLITSPKLVPKNIEIFEDRDRKKIEKYCVESNTIKDLGILLSLYAGLRIGEVCALKWNNVHLDKKILIIDHTIQRVYVGKNETKILYTSPKTIKSQRKIPLAQILVDKIKEIQNEKKYSKEAFILTGKEDKWVEPISYRYTYQKILKEENVEIKKYHVLRHTFATRCVKIGIDIKSLSEILGHSNVSITLNLYVHPSMETKNKYINKLCI